MNGMRYKLRCAATLSFLCILIVTVVCGTAGCSNDKQLIQNEINSTLSVFKDPTLESLYTYMQDNGASDEDLESAKKSFADIEKYGIDADEYLSYFFMDFDYTIGNISIDGSTATADITLTTKDFTAVASEFQDYIGSSEGIADMYDAYANAGFDEQAMYKVAWDKLYEIIDEADTTTTDFVLDLTKTSN